jgi:hypothetical protein
MNCRHVKTERENLVDEVSRLEHEARAESDFAAAFPGDPNPWNGSATALEAAKATLASLDEVERLNRFVAIIKRYRSFYEELETGNLKADLNEVQRKQNALGGYALLMKGALHRQHPPVSERDADERAKAREMKELDVDRIRLASQLDGCISNLQKMEQDHPFLRTYKSHLQAALQKSSAA